MTASRRHIQLEGASNLRDIGGYEAADGSHVRWGRIYRSGAMSRLTAADWEWMAAQNVAAVCDLRSAQERGLAPTQWQGGAQARFLGHAYDAAVLFEPLMRSDRDVAMGDMAHAVYPLFPVLLAPSFRILFAALLEGHTPLIVHCSAGQDRTGLAIGLVLTALGVPHDVIFEDYRLSTALRVIENEIDLNALAAHAPSNLVARFYVETLNRRGEAAFKPRPLLNRHGEPLLLDAFRLIEAQWGSLEDYLHQEIGVGPNEIARLRALYLALPEGTRDEA